jgi:methanethiol S-methyltransferase
MREVLNDHILLFVGWILFALIHHILANGRFKAYSRRQLGIFFKYYRLMYSIIAVVTLCMVMTLQISVQTITLNIPRVIAVTFAIPTGITGLCVMGICLSKYFFRLSGVQVLYGQPTSAKLETTGIHKHIRHPLYLGTLLFAWSLFLCFPLLSNLIACVSVTTYTLIGIRSEEQKLITLFGDDYKRYQQQTPMLIPRFSSVNHAG